MSSTYYPKYNLVLINGNKCFSDSFICFLNTIHTLQENIQNKHTKNLILSCFNLVIKDCFEKHKIIINKQNIFCKIVFCFSLSTFSINSDIFNYFNFKQLEFYIKLCLSKLKKEKILYTILQEKHIQTISSDLFYVELNPSSNIKEILNIINFNFLKK